MQLSKKIFHSHVFQLNNPYWIKNWEKALAGLWFAVCRSYIKTSTSKNSCPLNVSWKREMMARITSSYSDWNYSNKNIISNSNYNSSKPKEESALIYWFFKKSFPLAFLESDILIIYPRETRYYVTKSMFILQWVMRLKY